MPSDLSPMPSSDGFFEDFPGSHAESVDINVSEIELYPTVTRGQDVRAELDVSMASEANHLQDRCVDLATELFFVKNKLNEKTKELRWARRKGQAREEDFKEVRKLCDEERHSARAFMRQICALEEEKANIVAENNDLRLDKERLLGVVRRHKAAGLTEAITAHRERLRKRKMTEKEVNKCDLAKAKIELKATRQEMDQLAAKARGQAAHARALEDENAELAKQLADAEDIADVVRGEAEVARREADEARASERRMRSEMEREARLKEEALEKAARAKREQAEALEVKESLQREAESLREQLAAAAQQLSEKNSAHGRHQGSVARYQKIIDAQASALQAARQQLLGEKVRRQEVERQERLRHIANIDSRARVVPVPGRSGSREGRR